jgi:N-formylglutamate deformylase
MNRAGMRAVCTRTSSGASAPRRRLGRAGLIATYFEPYGRALADLVDDRLGATGRAVISDLHAFPECPLPYELYPDDERPAICLGSDDRHTSCELLDAAREAFAPAGSVAVNQPFRGT